jgi:hypothetical protein
MKRPLERRVFDQEIVHEQLSARVDRNHFRRLNEIRRGTRRLMRKRRGTRRPGFREPDPIVENFLRGGQVGRDYPDRYEGDRRFQTMEACHERSLTQDKPHCLILGIVYHPLRIRQRVHRVA